MLPRHIGTCTIVAEQESQLSWYHHGNRWSTCLAVDGIYSSERIAPLDGLSVPSEELHTGSFSQASVA